MGLIGPGSCGQLLFLHMITKGVFGIIFMIIYLIGICGPRVGRYNFLRGRSRSMFGSSLIFLIFL